MPGDQLEEQDTYKKSILSCFSLFQCLSPLIWTGIDSPKSRVSPCCRCRKLFHYLTALFSSF